MFIDERARNKNLKPDWDTNQNDLGGGSFTLQSLIGLVLNGTKKSNFRSQNPDLDWSKGMQDYNTLNQSFVNNNLLRFFFFFFFFLTNEVFTQSNQRFQVMEFVDLPILEKLIN